MKRYYKESRRIIISAYNNRMSNWIGHILCRNCLLKHLTEGAIEGMGRQGRCKHLNMAFKTGRCWKLEKGTLHCSLWVSGFGRGWDLS
jgi:hypothetical protein